MNQDELVILEVAETEPKVRVLTPNNMFITIIDFCHDFTETEASWMGLLWFRVPPSTCSYNTLLEGSLEAPLKLLTQHSTLQVQTT